MQVRNVRWFEVDDVRQALTELEAVGVAAVGSVEQDSEWEQIHFRAPDGHLYELASRREGTPPTP
ncbi:hypothetical protein EV138_4887 [Kribbella voronezhensis]|uniref:VOC domain-containing protein n=1 Tax=Kribbella voronezhensis TaxID=2512212 RepID=A0A4V3FKS0_9ACTN|nr:hypothetical protein [Kribbella voronezhensis]TDU91283.1 hypothetical protein EV138_4887 [Kribbella voronezhensis]